MEKENKTIYRPKSGTNVPDAQRFDPNTGESVDRFDLNEAFAALRQWFQDSKKDNRTDNESYIEQVTIDPKQAFYARKKGKDNE